MTAVCFAAAAIAAGSCSARQAAPEAAYAATAYKAAAGLLWEDTGFSGREAPAADTVGPELPEAGAVPGAEASRKLVYRASVSVRVQEPEKAGAALTALMEQYGAYSSSVNIWENSRHYTIRVPAAAYTALLCGLGDMVRVLHL
jgi:hypothetical protein